MLDIHPVNRIRQNLPKGPDVATAFYVASGSLVALWLAMWLQLDAPYWAGSTVIITFQATRSQSLIKGVNRIVGTVVGTGMGVALIAIFPQQWWGYLLAHTAWLVMCTVIACLLTEVRAYAAALSGYTTLIVALDAFGEPQHAFETAVSRGSSIFLGVTAFMTLTSLLSSDVEISTLKPTLNAWLDEGLTLTSRLLRDDADAGSLSHYLEFMGGLDGLIEQGAAEAPWISQGKPVLRGAFLALTDCVMTAAALTHDDDATSRMARETVAADLDSRRDSSVSGRRKRTEFDLDASRLEGTAGTRDLATIMEKAGTVLDGLAFLDRKRVLADQVRVKRSVDREVRTAMRGALRSFLAFGSACLLWVVTRWPSGNDFVLITGIVCGLFSFRPSSVSGTRKFTVGAIGAGVLAAWIGLFVLPLLGSFESMAAVLFPFLFLAAIGVRISAVSGYVAPFNLLFLAMMGIHNQMSYDALTFFNSLFATISGAFYAALWYMIIPPLSKNERIHGLKQRIDNQKYQLSCLRDFNAEKRLLFFQRIGNQLALSDTKDGTRLIGDVISFWKIDR